MVYIERSVAVNFFCIMLNHISVTPREKRPRVTKSVTPASNTDGIDSPVVKRFIADAHHPNCQD